jgi:hypothetical protein
MMEAASTSETSVNFYQTTWRNNPEDSYLQDRKLLLKIVSMRYGYLTEYKDKL